jgi:RHH-type proline utilization regulon transcriptional repressor/proline dehydrogenase/delta 1-pyrroline-5-carboxylate dehydrogenase
MKPELAAIRAAWLQDEAECVTALLPAARLPDAAAARVQTLATRLVEGVRDRGAAHAVDDFLAEYGLSTPEGVALLCIAEALLRIPDAATADALLRDKLSSGDWERHLGGSESLWVNAATWGLLVSGQVVAPLEDEAPATILNRLAARIGEPVVRAGIQRAVGVLANQFVRGQTIGEAVNRSREAPAWERHSYDMLGEAAMTAADAGTFFDRYHEAIAAVATARSSAADVFDAPGISIKLSALHPRYEPLQAARVQKEIVPRVHALAMLARDTGIGITLDAEETDRLDLMLDVFERLARDKALAGWYGLGLAVQAYQKRAPFVLDWLIALARATHRRIPVRLVKGAYWDSEIKLAQQAGLTEYPVFTRKAATDVSYLACARKMLAARDALYCQFATHNAHSIAYVLESAGGGPLEFQRLHGMGEALYAVLAGIAPAMRCRVYCPVGSHGTLLPYLMRRLLENGANTSFVHRLLNARASVAEVVRDPVAAVADAEPARNPRIPLPVDLYGEWRNSTGVHLADETARAALRAGMDSALRTARRAMPVVRGERLVGGATHPVANPGNIRDVVGQVSDARPDDIEAALAATSAAQPKWDALGVEARAAILDRAADAIESARAELIALIVAEGGRCIPDAVSEVREAADYCRYYAQLARRQFASQALPGPTGERNSLSLHGRGAFLCVSPWNFPVAIFAGQIAAALAAGNTVVAKPASQTALAGFRVVELLLEAGVPDDVLAFLPAPGARIASTVLKDRRLAGVAFTGSTGTARAIARSLAERDGPVVPLIAETGGINAMIVDSSALPEQVVRDAIASAFNSAGQRCSALRVLCLQNEIAPRVIEMLAGAMAELKIGDAREFDADVGPIIDAAQRGKLIAHADRMCREARIIHEVALPPGLAQGYYFAPRAFEITSMDMIREEIFGPILHVARFARDKLDAVIEAINASGYGLTLGIHTRIEETARHIAARGRVGNIYVNRNQIGAVVGVQPFGGEGLSGTGPKAGGRHYLTRFAVERTISINTAVTGNPELFGAGES